MQEDPRDLPNEHLGRSSYVTIIESVQETTYELTVSDSTPQEGDRITFTVTRTGDRPEETVCFSTLSGTATFGNGDYALAHNGGRPVDVAIDFGEGDRTGTVQIVVVDASPPVFPLWTPITQRP